MPEKKTADRRTLKTKRAIRRALSELLKEKELRKITVQEIIEKAEISRFTFYKYYLDVYDLYDKIERETLIHMSVIMLQIENKTTESFFEKLTEYISDNSSAFEMIFSPNTKSSLRDKLSRIIEGMFRKLYSEKLDIPIDDRELVYTCCYRSQGCLAVIQNWVTNGFAEPGKDIVRLLTALDRLTEGYFSDKTAKG